MAAKFIASILLLTASLIANAQHAPDHVALMTDAWRLLDTRVIKTDKNGLPHTIFPPPLKAINNKVISLPGYMIPISSGLTHQDFMLSVLPVLQCQFCGQAKVPDMVAVHLLKAIPYTDKPLRIKGLLVLNGWDETLPAFLVRDAVTEELNN